MLLLVVIGDPRSVGYLGVRRTISTMQSITMPQTINNLFQLDKVMSTKGVAYGATMMIEKQNTYTKQNL